MTTQINFMARRNLAVTVSSITILLSIIAMAIGGMNLGLDFTGGTLLEVRLRQAESLSSIREVMMGEGSPSIVVQALDSETDFLLKVSPRNSSVVEDQSAWVSESLNRHFPGSEIRRNEFVGPTVGEDLRDAAGFALLTALGGIGAYVMWRFTGKFAIAAIIALIHDVLITVGFFAVFQLSVDMQTLAALMTIIGYSLNDTIVICDRIRENLRAHRHPVLIDIINLSLNQTLERTLVMAGTTLTVVMVMFFLGGEHLRGFATVLFIGIIVGTYSSIYVAAAYLVYSRLARDDLLVPPSETLSERE